MVHQIESNLYARQGKAITNFERAFAAPQSDLASEILKDPYHFEFLELHQDAQERDLEEGPINHIRNPPESRQAPLVINASLSAAMVLGRPMAMLSSVVQEMEGIPVNRKTTNLVQLPMPMPLSVRRKGYHKYAFGKDVTSMARLAFKPDASFFRKIAIGAVGTRAICADLATHGHEVAELERGSTDTKLWKEVKRKRVRIPDLVCVRCGQRIESRAKTKPELSMSHNPEDQSRSWDYGMVEGDLVAFPVCDVINEEYWSSGRLGTETSYWHERNWVRWQARSYINYFRVDAFRSTPHDTSSTKGVTEGSETSISWNATFSTFTGTVEAVDADRVTLRRGLNGRLQTWPNRKRRGILVSPGEMVHHSQVIISDVKPVIAPDLACPGLLPADRIARLLASRERTQRFTGVKLARLRKEEAHETAITNLTADIEEDIYIRLEGASYLASVCGHLPQDIFTPFLDAADEQTQLEAVIALGEAATPEAVDVLSNILISRDMPYFLRSAAAWSLSRVGSPVAITTLVAAFADVDDLIREEALDGIVSIGAGSASVLLAGLSDTDNAVAAGCAEALRQQQPLSDEAVASLIAAVHGPDPSRWTVWLSGQLPREHVAMALADLADTAPHLHYALSLLWSFMESWISQRWERHPQAVFPTQGETNDL